MVAEHIDSWLLKVMRATESSNKAFRALMFREHCSKGGGKYVRGER